MRRITLACIILLTFVAPSFAADQFEGKWKVEFMPDPDATGAKDFKDTVEFTSLTLTSEYFKKLGMKTEKYEADTRGFTGGKFEAQLKNDAGDTVAWEGYTATGTELRGTIVWTKKDGTVWRYSYTGTR